MKPDLEKIDYKLLYNNIRPSNVDAITRALLDAINDDLAEWTEEVQEWMEEMEKATKDEK